MTALELKTPALAALLGVLAWTAPAQSSGLEALFEPVPMQAAMPDQRERAWAFRSLLPSSADEQSPAGRWLSLLPAQPKWPPTILETTTGKLIPLAIFQSGAPDAPPVRKVLEFGAFDQGYARVKVKVGTDAGTYERWGYVDLQGNWALPPVYSKARPVVNGWAGVTEYGESPSFIHIKSRTTLTFPQGNLRGDGLSPVGPHVYYWLEENIAQPNPVLILAGSHQQIDLGPLGGHPQINAPFGRLLILDSGNLYDTLQQRLYLRPENTENIQPLLPEAVSLSYREPDNSKLLYRAWSPQRGKTLAQGMYALKEFTSRWFIACDKAENSSWPRVSLDPESPQRVLAPFPETRAIALKTPGFTASYILVLTPPVCPSPLLAGSPHPSPH